MFDKFDKKLKGIEHDIYKSKTGTRLVSYTTVALGLGAYTIGNAVVVGAAYHYADEQENILKKIAIYAATIGIAGISLHLFTSGVLDYLHKQYAKHNYHSGRMTLNIKANGNTVDFFNQYPEYREKAEALAKDIFNEMDKMKSTTTKSASSMADGFIDILKETHESM